MASLDFGKLKSRIDLSEVLDLIGFETKERSGHQVRGRCPIHGGSGKDRAFSANLAKKTFQCFKCGASGNHLDLWVLACKQPVYEAALDLCHRLNKEVPWQSARTEKRNP